MIVALAHHYSWLNPLHGDNYQFWSGIGSDFAIFTGLVAFTLKHNCYTHGCLRIARVLGPDGHHRCGRCHRALR